MGVGQLSESDAVDALRLPFYSSSHPTGSHGWRNQFDLGNPELAVQSGSADSLFQDVDVTPAAAPAYSTDLRAGLGSRLPPSLLLFGTSVIPSWEWLENFSQGQSQSAAGSGGDSCR